LLRARPFPEQKIPQQPNKASKQETGLKSLICERAAVRRFGSMVQRLIAFILVMACLNGGAARAATPSVTGRLLFDGQLFSAPVQPSF